MNRFLLLAPVAILLVGAGAPEDVVNKELKKFDGTWTMVSGERDGVKVADEHAAKSKIVYRGKDLVVDVPSQANETIKVKIVALDPTKKPAEMSWVRENGPDAGKTTLAIYEFIDNDTYRICFAVGGKDRPTEFRTKAGAGQLMHTWKRAGK